MANNKNFIAKNGVSTGDGYSMPDIRPSLLLDFANSKTLDPRITFTRGSTGTYWDGKTTTKAEENLITYSQDFDNANWGKFGAGLLTNNTTAPDGTSTAEKLYTDTSSSYHYTTQNSNVTAGVHTASVYIKAAGYNYAGIRFTADSFGGTRYSVVIDLTNGTFVDDYTIGSPSYTPSYAITSVGNDWYRLSVTVEQTQSSGYMNMSIFITDDSTPTWATTGLPTFTGDGSSGVYLWGAQIEQRSSATAYTATTSSPIVKYQPTLQTAASGEARFDHDPVTGESKGLLVEEARTNSLTRSEDFSNAAWTKAQVTIEADKAVAPDGTLTADKLVVTNLSTTHSIAQLGVISSQTCAASIFAKAAGETTFTILDGASANNGASFNLSTGVVTAVNSGTGTMVYVGNGWYRCTAVMTTTGFRLYCPNSSGTAPGNGFDGILIWGAQLEAGAFPTSYIPTSGSTVTRSLDTCTFLDLSQIDYNQGNGTTMLIEAQTPDTTTLRGLMNFSQGNENNFYGICVSGGDITGRVRANSTYEVINSTVTGLSAGAYSTTAMAVHFNNPKSAQTATNGTVSTADTSFSQTVPEQITRLAIGTISSSSYVINGCVKKAALYPKAFNSATLQAMTEA